MPTGLDNARPPQSFSAPSSLGRSGGRHRACKSGARFDDVEGAGSDRNRAVSATARGSPSTIGGTAVRPRMTPRWLGGGGRGERRAAVPRLLSREWGEVLNLLRRRTPTVLRARASLKTRASMLTES